MIIMNTLLNILLLITYVSLVSTESFCDNWESFKDEKCVNILNVSNLVTYEEAVELCSKAANGSTLITIHSKEEQEFIEKYLFETRKIVENVWLGLKKSNNSFEWIDKTSVEFTNWANGFPSNKSDHKCCEMISETSPIGKWYDIQCTKKNIAVCQRPLLLTVELLKKKLSETNDLLTKTTEDFNRKLKEMSSQMNSCRGYIGFTSLPFTDFDGKQRAFIFPESENKNTVNWDEASNICDKYNATLIEINSQQKQNILESFLKQLDSSRYKYFWLNGHKDSSGKWKWLWSGNDFTFTNWYSGFPTNNSGHDYIHIDSDWGNVLGKWYNIDKGISISIICQLEVKH